MGRHSRNGEAIATMLFALVVWMSSAACGWTQEKLAPSPDTEVVVYGKEQALVDSVTAAADRQPKQEYRNDLDRALSVLLARAYPRPNAHDIVQHAVDALCRDIENVAPDKISNAQRNSWLTSTEKTMSFEPVLNDLLAQNSGRVTQQQLIDAGLTAMLSATRSKSAGVLSASEAESMANMMEARSAAGKECGTLGIDVSNWPTIKVIPGMPAAKAGLRDGDVMLRVNSRDVASEETGVDGLKTLRAVDTEVVHLTIKRGGETLSFQVRPTFSADRITASVVAPGVVDIQIPAFEGSGIADRANELIRKHVADAKTGFILDLRNNPGGRAEEANAVADTFLDEKLLQIFQFRDGKRVAFKSKPGALDVPLVVLINRGTASAAEMLAMALHDNRRATLIGEPTAGALYGKHGEMLSDGRIIFFRTEPTILSPVGKDYSETGISPDILVAGSKSAGDDKILARAIKVLGNPP